MIVISLRDCVCVVGVIMRLYWGAFVDFFMFMPLCWRTSKGIESFEDNYINTNDDVDKSYV
jgi:hypothetical protein